MDIATVDCCGLHGLGHLGLTVVTEKAFTRCDFVLRFDGMMGGKVGCALRDMRV